MARAPVHIRWMIQRDYPTVLAIHGGWELEDLHARMKGQNVIGMVAEEPDTEQIVGFMIYELQKRLMHIREFAVHKDWRRCQVGQQMFAKLASKVSVHRRRGITAQIADDNLGGHLFAKAMEFRAVSMIRCRNGDSYWFRYMPELACANEVEAGAAAR